MAVTPPTFPSAAPNPGNNSAAEQGTNIPVGWKATAQEPVPVVRCTANRRDGERCKRWSLRGATVCQKHGGSLPNVKAHAEAVVESARMRLMGLADEAVDVLEELLQPGTTENVRMKAVENVLDRVGLKSAVEVKVEVTDGVAPSETINERLSQIAARLAPKPVEPEPEDLGEVVDEPAG
jgi:phosphoglycolate phosphatase-like HAD superfamily hydrolase